MILDNREYLLKKLLADRILILDGAMGTMIQNESLTESDYRNKRFLNFNKDLKGNSDILSITQPNIISNIHDKFFEAGADIITTNTFNANKISQSDYGLEGYVKEINIKSASLAKTLAEKWTLKTPDKPRFVAGALGPTNRTASISPKVDDPGYRNIDFDELIVVYKESANALLEGGADILLLETIFDTLNAKAALFAISDLFESNNQTVPVMISGTITDMSGRNLSGQTVEAFWYSLQHIKPMTIGLNCAFGAEHLTPPLKELSRIADTYISAYPNAGLPNPMGDYDELPDTTAKLIYEWANQGLVNIVGGCCGTTPEHIKSISLAISKCQPRKIPKFEPALRLSGLEHFIV